MEKKDAGRIRVVATRTLSNFIRLEEGSAGKQSALKTGAMLGGSVLAQVLLSTLESAEAACHGSAGGHTSDSAHGSAL